jgi:hypothetical protein
MRSSINVMGIQQNLDLALNSMKIILNEQNLIPRPGLIDQGYLNHQSTGSCYIKSKTQSCQ